MSLHFCSLLNYVKQILQIDGSHSPAVPYALLIDGLNDSSCCTLCHLIHCPCLVNWPHMIDLSGLFFQVFAAPYSLRFPRIDKVRYDKPWHECLDVQCKRT